MCNTISGYKHPLEGKKNVVRIPKKGVGIKMVNGKDGSAPFKATPYQTEVDGWIVWDEVRYGKKRAFTFFPSSKDVEKYLGHRRYKGCVLENRFEIIEYEGGIQMREDDDFRIKGARVGLCKRFRFIRVGMQL